MTNDIKRRGKKTPGKHKTDITDRVKALLEKFELQTTGPEFRISVADYIRLIQMRLEMEDTGPQKMEVRWVDPDESGGHGE